MVKNHYLRDIAASHYKNGKKAPEIPKLLANKAHRNMSDRWLHRHKQPASIYVKRKCGRPKTASTKQRILFVKKQTSLQHSSKKSLNDGQRFGK